MEELINIHKVEPSEYLFNRIQHRIEQIKKDEIALPKVYAIAAFIVFLIAINFNTISYKNTQKNQTLSIKTTNNFYDEESKSTINFIFTFIIN